MNKDTVVGILGAVILVAAMVGIFYYEGTQTPAGPGSAGTGSGPFAVTWATATAAGPTASGNAQEGESTEEPVNISASNITQVEFVLTWTDDNAQSQPDQFTLTVRTPDGRVFNSTDTTGTVRVLVNPVNRAPALERTGGASEADAMRALAQQYSTTNGTGTWQVTVTLVDAGDVQPIPGVPVPGGTPLSDTGNAWSLATQVSTYRAEVARAA